MNFIILCMDFTNFAHALYQKSLENNNIYLHKLTDWFFAQYHGLATTLSGSVSCTAPEHALLRRQTARFIRRFRIRPNVVGQGRAVRPPEDAQGHALAKTYPDVNAVTVCGCQNVKVKMNI